MNEVCGKVLLRETSAGIPDLLVEIYDVDPGTRPEEMITAPPASGIAVMLGVSTAVPPANLIGDRLGSVLTDTSGWFKLEYEDAEFRRRNSNEQRPDLLLIVRAPEEVDGDADTRILYVSKDLRQGAGSTETYMIRIPNQKLTAAGLAAPTGFVLDSEEPEAIIQKVNLAVSRQVRVNQEVQKIAAQQVAVERRRTTQIEKRSRASYSRN